jgi:hypothetical protein
MCKTIFHKSKYPLLPIVFILMAQFTFAQCACKYPQTSQEWIPEANISFDKLVWSNNYYYTPNGMYISEDDDSLYMIKIIVDSKNFATFIHYQHISFYKKSGNAVLKNVLNCNEEINAKDGGWFGSSIYKPSSFSREYIYFRTNNSFTTSHSKKLFHFIKCSGGKPWQELGLYDVQSKRFYIKNTWMPKGNYLDVSLKTFYQDDVKKYTKAQLAAMRNEVFARYNYKFKEGNKWYNYFDTTINYRWNFFENVEPFLTTIEKENLSYIKAFESDDYYDNQLRNDFLKFWESFRQNVLHKDVEKQKTQIKWPLQIHGDFDDMPVLKINQNLFPQVWKIIFKQAYFGIGENGKLSQNNIGNLFQNSNAFAKQMIHTKSNYLENLSFENEHNNWKLTTIYADNENYNEIENLLDKTKRNNLP